MGEYYDEQWEAIWYNPQTGGEESFQFSKYPFENPHQAAKECWPRLRGKRFKVKFYRRRYVENKWSIQNFLKAKEEHQKKQRRR